MARRSLEVVRRTSVRQAEAPAGDRATGAMAPDGEAACRWLRCACAMAHSRRSRASPCRTSVNARHPRRKKTLLAWRGATVHSDSIDGEKGRRGIVMPALGGQTPLGPSFTYGSAAHRPPPRWSTSASQSASRRLSVATRSGRRAARSVRSPGSTLRSNSSSWFASTSSFHCPTRTARCWRSGRAQRQNRRRSTTGAFPRRIGRMSIPSGR
jgi:hypothetical protein